MDPESFFGIMIGFGLVVVVPIVAILTSHQRKMAELMARRNVVEQSQTDHARIAQLEAELYELKQIVNSHIIAEDHGLTSHDLRQNPVASVDQERRLTPPLPEDVQARIR